MIDKLVLKGDFDTLKSYETFVQTYAYIEPGLKMLAKEDFVGGKRELTFTGTSGNLIGHTVKLIENKTTKTLTVILK